MLAYYWLAMMFVLGAVVGSFLNVAIARLPLEKSLIWPGSRCGKCQQPIRWYDNLPLISYLWLRGRCRTCGESFSSRYFFVELGTASGFAALFYIEVICNWHNWPGAMQWANLNGIFPFSWWVGYLHHAILFALLFATAMCDLDCREIPLGITIPGTLLGILIGTIFPWPWPIDPAAAWPAAQNPNAWLVAGAFKEGTVQAWPFWGPLPAWFGAGGNWQTGLVTAFVGAAVGSLLLRGIGFIFSTALGKEALGLGDADLMMMAGAFLGWQMAAVAFFVSVVPALFVGFFQIAFRRDNSLPFGPSLAMGVVITFLGWQWLGPYVQPLFFWGQLLAILVGVACVLLALMGLLLRLLRGAPGAEPPAA